MKHDTPWTQERRINEQTQLLVLVVVACRKTSQCCKTNDRVAAMACPCRGSMPQNKPVLQNEQARNEL